MAHGEEKQGLRPRLIRVRNLGKAVVLDVPQYGHHATQRRLAVNVLGLPDPAQYQTIPRRRAGSPTCVPSHRGAHAPFQRGPRAAVRQPCRRPTSTVPYRGAHDPTRGAQGAAARLATPLLQRGSGAAAETTRSYTVGPLGDAYGSRGRPGRAGSHRGAHQRAMQCKTM